MPSSIASDMLTDPNGVIVDLVLGHEPGLDRLTVVGIVEAVAGGRAKQRRLARALLERPTVLTDGRSPAPRGIGDLLIALNHAGASGISAPLCAGCSKQLNTLQRRGPDWYCAACGPRREPCVKCGSTRPVYLRDRDGGPRCSNCPLDDGRDPTPLIVDIVTRVDPTLAPEVITAAIDAAVPRVGRRYRLVWTLQDRPDLLIGAGAEAPDPAVLRLIDRLVEAGAHKIVHPACPGCGRIIHLHRPIGGTWLCRNCTAKSRAQACARCGAVREAGTRDEQGRPICPTCLVRDPVNQETCAGCGRRRPVSTRAPDGPRCETCRPRTTTECAICGRTAPCTISVATGSPWCDACHKRWARCVSCGEIRPVRGGTVDEPLCAECVRDEPGFWRTCPGCGQRGRLHTSRCARCTVQQRLRQLLGDEHGAIRADLQALYQALAAVERPDTVAKWLDDGGGPAILRALEAGRRLLSHEALDELPPGKPVEHLRSVLVAIGTLPHRDEQLLRLQRWTAELVAMRTDPEERSVLHRYAVWHVIRRLRSRIGDGDTTYGQARAAKRHIKSAGALLDWLAAHDLTLATAGQGDLDRWLSTAAAGDRRDSGNFVRWARRHKLTRLDHAAQRWDGPTGVIDTETRWEQARRLLHDDTVETTDRVAGLLVLLYAQTASAIAGLTIDDIQFTDQQVRLRLGREPILIPTPLDQLVRDLVQTRAGHAVVGGRHASPWLFPGGQPAHHLSAFRMAERLRQLGIQASRARSAALFQLAGELPAAVLARTLGIHISVAAAWQRASSGDWLAYAAEISRSQKRPVAATPSDPIPATEADHR
ncbi:hypothetical protein [Mycobacterium avium]|uniref:hypothetical protein n=1 Tax=Mycobacterium avium TaxID=1764 RepID=UPI0009FC6A66|nr:hypothetical protein [Mycobacterium avium]